MTGGLEDLSGCLGIFLCVIVVVVILLFVSGAVGDWASVEIEQAKAAGEARRAEAAQARADAEKVREREKTERTKIEETAKTERAEIQLETEKRKGINAWIRALSFRMDVASCLPFWPALAVMLILAPLGGFALGKWRRREL